MAQVIDCLLRVPEFKPQYHQKETNNNNNKTEVT
jgi:hypothetical protein